MFFSHLVGDAGAREPNQLSKWRVRRARAAEEMRLAMVGKRGVCYFDVDEETRIFKPQYGAVS